jgi:hypothetical protein
MSDKHARDGDGPNNIEAKVAGDFGSNCKAFMEVDPPAERGCVFYNHGETSGLC